MSGRCFDPCVGLWFLIVGLWLKTMVAVGLWFSVFGRRCATPISAETVVAAKRFGLWCDPIWSCGSMSGIKRFR